MTWWTRKSISGSDAEDTRRSGPHLHRGLGLWNLSAIGIGCTIGAGIFVLTGTAAASYAGPAVALAFVFAAIACLCSALCYAELASMFPMAGSAYTYAYATMGELAAWIVGWNLVLEYLLSVSTVAVGWSGYWTAFLAELGLRLPVVITEPPFIQDATGQWIRGGMINAPAVAIVLTLAAVLSFGIRESASFNNAMVAVKLLVIVLVIGFGAAHVHPANWHPFVPPNSGELGRFGWSGVLRAAGVVFFAYIGFDSVSTAAQESRNPKRDVPLALLITLIVCTLLYVMMSLVITGLAPYNTLDVPHPVFVAVDHAGSSLAWLKPIVTIGAIVGLASAILTTLYGQVRIFYAMGGDGMVPQAFAKIHERYQVPVLGTWYCGIAAALVAGVFPIEVLGELVSIGTLLAFAIVCAGFLLLRRREPQRTRAFRAPFGIGVGVGGLTACAVLMLGLPHGTWLRLTIWLAIGFIFYLAYGHRHSQLRAPSTGARTPGGGRDTDR